MDNNPIIRKHTENAFFTKLLSLRVLAVKLDFPNPFIPCNTMYSVDFNCCKAIFNCVICKHNISYNEILFYKLRN